MTKTLFFTSQLYFGWIFVLSIKKRKEYLCLRNYDSKILPLTYSFSPLSLKNLWIFLFDSTLKHELLLLKSDQTGTVVDIVAEDGKPVNLDTVSFLISLSLRKGNTFLHIQEKVFLLELAFCGFIISIKRLYRISCIWKRSLLISMLFACVCVWFYSLCLWFNRRIGTMINGEKEATKSSISVRFGKTICWDLFPWCYC